METPYWLAREFLRAEPKDRVGRLVDLGRALGFPDPTQAKVGGIAAGIVSKHGHGVSVVYAMGMGLVAQGDPWEFVLGVLKNGRDATARRGSTSGGRRNPGPGDVERAKRA